MISSQAWPFHSVIIPVFPSRSAFRARAAAGRMKRQSKACPGRSVMPITVEAVYEGGVLKPVEPLPLREHEKVRVTVQQEASAILRAYGIMGWTGSAELAERFAT